MRPIGTARQLERRRLRAIEFLEKGWKPVDVARLLGVDRRSVRRWNAAYRLEGASGLAARPVPGRPSKLTKRQRESLQQLLSCGARASGCESDVWTVRRVAQVIRRRFGVPYHGDHIGRLLRSLE